MENNSFGQKVLKGLKWFFFSYIWLFLVFFAVDIISKQLVVRNLNVGDSITLIPGTAEKPFLAITYTVNTNAAFSIGTQSALTNRILYSIIAFIGFGLILGFYIWKFKKINALTKACLMLMCVGALGNLVDRLFYSPEFLKFSENGVVDFIDFAVIWPFISNIADSCVVVGVIILVVYLIVEEIKAVKANRNKEVKETGGKVLSKEEQSRLEPQDPKTVERRESFSEKEDEFDDDDDDDADMNGHN